MSRFAMCTGRLIDIHRLTENDIDIKEIAHHLANIQRFNGGLPLGVRYSIAEHCINLANYFLFEEQYDFAVWALLHDASEAYLSDIVSPVKKGLKDYRQLEANVQSIIENKYLGEYTMGGKVCECDRRIVLDEVETIMPNKYIIYKREMGLEKLGTHIMYNNHPATVYRCYLQALTEIGVI